MACLAALPRSFPTEYVDLIREIHHIQTMPKPPSSLHVQAGSISDEEIRERAYDIWERHHRPEGFEMQFWFLAKRELMSERETRIASDTALDEEVLEQR